ncbi:MAG TPA: glycosyltransferase family 9 protein [Bryobacteraceae bacterium]|nr:glycosyltransferase family 9 protein [Bryobacteraceae bacterium]
MSTDPSRARTGSEALFRVLVEGIADRFDPQLSRAYAGVVSRAIARAIPGRDPGELAARYHRVRRVRPFHGSIGRDECVYVLSRVTLGADVAITSVLLDAVKRRFPEARICLVGGEKSRELFAADSRIEWLPVDYGRHGTLRERLAAGQALAARLASSSSLVIDPDSRLTQLGLLPVCPEENYFLFESRAYGGDSEDSLTALAQRWAAEVFGVEDAAPYVALAEVPRESAGPFILVNLGVGGNPAKRIPGDFEQELLRLLLGKGRKLLADLGAGGEEEERVRRAIAGCAAPEGALIPWRGSFAALAALTRESSLYVGYDSGGQHAAAVCGTPLVTIFAGSVSPRMFARWRPTGPGRKEVIQAGRADSHTLLERIMAAADRLMVV